MVLLFVVCCCCCSCSCCVITVVLVLVLVLVLRTFQPSIPSPTSENIEHGHLTGGGELVLAGVHGH